MKGTKPDQTRLGLRRAFWMTASVITLFVCALLVLAPQVLAQNRSSESERAIAILRDVFEFVRRNYVDADAAGTDQLLKGALKGMLEAVDDPYTEFVDRDGIDKLNDMTTGEFGGVGLYIDTVDDGVLVIEPFPGSPAHAAGIIAGDLIVAIDGTQAGGLNEAGVVSRLRGSPGTDVHVSLVRAGGETLEVTVTRDLIEVPTVRHALIEPEIGYLRGQSSIHQQDPGSDSRGAERPAGPLAIADSRSARQPRRPAFRRRRDRRSVSRFGHDRADPLARGERKPGLHRDGPRHGDRP